MKDKIAACRRAIRAHRDAKGDDRCWVDDYTVWAQAGLPDLTVLPPYDEAMSKCRAYYTLRQAGADTAPSDALHDPAQWDKDLDAMTEKELSAALEKLHAAIQKHQSLNDRTRTVESDRALYSVLPEKLPADFRLPPEADFLGEGKAPHAGCPSFWRSHAACAVKCHNLHKWGPCRD